jgi:preprotein translocase subunit SecG
MLIEAAGGGSNFMFGMAGFMRDIKAVVMNTFILCIIILSVMAIHFSHNLL